MNRKNDVIGTAGHGLIMQWMVMTWCNYCLHAAGRLSPVAGRLLPIACCLAAG